MAHLNYRCLTKLSFVLVVISISLSCTAPKSNTRDLVLNEREGRVPHTHDRFDSRSDKFSFAIVSDLWGGYRSGIFEVAVEQINLLRPEFILSVGDLIDGGTEDRDQLTSEWNHFDTMIHKARAPFFYTGGNHDLTNVVMRDVWEVRYGRRYYHFIYKDVLFLILDSEDYDNERMQEIYEARSIAIEIMDGKREGNAATSAYFKMPERRTGELSDDQIRYFETVIRDNTNVRWTFLLMHKPVWLREGRGNLDRIESALDTRPYTVINGHYHTYAHTERHGRDYIMLGTTGGAQNDKSVMAFDHFTYVTMTAEGPSVANLKLEGVLTKQGAIPGYRDGMCFEAAKCSAE